MFEEITEEELMQRMLDSVPETVGGAAIDKREGSIIYDALAPAAQELYLIYTCLDDILEDVFADTADREYLVKRAAERGIIPRPATNAWWRGEFNIDVDIGSMFTIDDLTYTVISRISAGVFELRCETAGSIGNQLSGALIPVEYIDELESAQLTTLLIPGEDEEETEAFRQRYFDSFNAMAFGGNVADYQNKAGSIAGVGTVRVIPAWQGGGTVKLIITDAQYHAPSQELIDEVQAVMDPPPQGTGIGLAPIGHVVTVEGAASVPVNITCTLEYETDYDWNSVSDAVYAQLDAYYDELSERFGASEQITIRIAQIEARVLDVTGIIDITGVQINGQAENLELGANDLPHRGTWNGA
jgi:uncharacterized phage protein gp47/JayE